MSEKYDKVLQDFTPLMAHAIMEEGESQSEGLMRGLRMLQGRNHNFVMVIRFDLVFKINLSDLPCDFDKFNLLWYEQTKDERVGDCIHAFHDRYLDPFLSSLRDCPHKQCIHFIRPYLKKHIEASNIHIMFDGFIDSNSDKQENPMYDIKRGILLGDLGKSFYNKYLRGNKVKLLGLK